MAGLLLYCRGGFENECAAEIQGHAARFGVAGFVKAKADTGFVIFETYEADAAAHLHGVLPFAELIFVRQWFVITAWLTALPVTDRVTAIVAGAGVLPEPPRAVFLETPDTNEGKELSGLCRALRKPLDSAYRLKAEVVPVAGIRLHVCFLSGTAAYVGYAAVRNSAAWPMGIPRLKSPRGAPSRSTLKLDEALLEFLSPAEREAFLRPGMRAVDLGAAPGGWTWQLVRRHIRVTAVDNGAMDGRLLESGLVEHVRADGFRYRPKEAVDWMVCDIVEQPIRVAELAAAWVAEGGCRHTVFNLKLPMKKRYQEIQRCLAQIREKLDGAGLRYHLRCKQLYHDREEVTVYLRREG